LIEEPNAVRSEDPHLHCPVEWPTFSASLRVFGAFMTGWPGSYVENLRDPADSIHRLRISLDNVEPPIWRTESYSIVSSFDQFEYRDEAPLFRRLSQNFELCVFGLNLVKQDLEKLKREYYSQLKQTLHGDDPSRDE